MKLLNKINKKKKIIVVLLFYINYTFIYQHTYLLFYFYFYPTYNREWIIYTYLLTHNNYIDLFINVYYFL